ncbi:hypothetical protein ABFS82_02G107800 [Erythranthe guttata]|uniref:uncharacterized protein LOC105969768 n=1 Tax=Erythranthe guttata TaxID=4155 RepID=UPI00064DD9D3|nr:PREDICTED: uncharacterized protein LOC105969768 [Erythranthe guttata]|eukprot:XP_012850002.1 PREDICTED: uncharacterized protein LOC105969768 [Erythranthe guttata]
MFQSEERKEKPLQEPKEEEELQFSWGIKKEVITLYESFTLDGTEYFLYDCVYLWRAGQDEPDIGKLVKIWETENREKHVEVVWFFRPIDITNWLGDIKPFRREIFLACGQGKGLSNLEPLEAISGKCNVTCSSKHKRNPQPSEEELRMADYIFYRTFDVAQCTISDKFPSSICGVEVDHFFNRKKGTKSSVCAEPKEHSKARSEETPVRATKNEQSAKEEKSADRLNVAATSGGQTKSSMKEGSRPVVKIKFKRPADCLSASPSGVSPLKKRKLLLAEGSGNDGQPYTSLSRVSGLEKRMNDKDSVGEKKYLSTGVSLDNKSRMFVDKRVGSKQHMTQTMRYKYTEVTRRPGIDSSKWLKLEVWEGERLREANEKGTLIILENLDPSFTSAEVEDIVWHVFQQKVKAKMVQPTAVSSPHNGQALVIFKTKEAADNVISQLINGCLILGDGRLIVGRRRKLGKSGVSGGFLGHLRIDRTKPYRQREEMRNAVSTSHFSQSNTVEYEMAIHWSALHEKSNMWWAALYEGQGKEIEDLTKQMKIHHLEP